MMLQGEIDRIELEFAELKARLTLFEAESKSTIQNDHNNMLLRLRKSVDSVEGTVSYLASGTSSLAGYVEFHKSRPVKDATSKAIVHQHLMDMDANLTALHQAASSGLEGVEHIKKTADVMHDELCAIRTKLESLSERTQSALKKAKETLGDKKQQMAEADTSLRLTRLELRTLEGKMEEEKDGRNVMRVARVATWGIGIFFPPMILVAGGLESVAYAMRKDRERLQGVINSANTKLSSLQSEVATLEGQKKSLDKAVEVAHELSLRSESIDSGSQEIKNLIRERVVEYQALKESTDEFSSWTHELKDQTASMRSLGASQSLLRNTTKRIVDSLLDKDQKDVKRICEKLKRL